MVPTVKRMAGFKDKRGNYSIVPVILNVDVNNHCTPFWPTVIQYDGVSWKFLMTGPNKRVLYEEVSDTKENQPELTTDEIIAQLEHQCESQYSMLKMNHEKIKDLASIITQQNQQIKILKAALAELRNT